MRRLVIDCQILQTPAYDRGMGKYTLSLLEAFLEANDNNKYYQEIQLLFNNNLEKSKQRINNIEKRLKDTENIFLDLPTDLSVDLHKKYSQAQNSLTEFIQKTTTKSTDTDFLITAPFFVDFAATFPANDSVRKFSIVYDLIPHKIWHLQRIFPDDIYFNHYKLFLEADFLFTISNAVKDDLKKLVGIPAHKIKSIDGGPFERLIKKKSKHFMRDAVRPYILMPSAPIVHKNNERAVQGFEQFNKKHNYKYNLYITSTFDNTTKTKLKVLSKNVVFTGNVTDTALAEAFNDSEAVLFPSLAEGLGMPVLEAALYNIPVACSDIPVLSELSDTAFYQFDPSDPAAIAVGLERAVNKVNWQQRLDAYKNLLKKYTWERTADLLMSGIRTVEPNKRSSKKLNLVMPRPNHDSPAGYLGELVYAGLNHDYEVGLKFSDNLPQDAPAYVAHLPESELQAAPVITFTNKRRSFMGLKFQKPQVNITNELDGHTQNLTINAKRIFLDKALQLKAWRYYDSSNHQLEPQDIIGLIHGSR